MLVFNKETASDGLINLNATKYRITVIEFMLVMIRYLFGFLELNILKPLFFAIGIEKMAITNDRIIELSTPLKNTVFFKNIVDIELIIDEIIE